MKVEVNLMMSNTKNLNGRIYSTEILRDIVNQFESKKPMYGELGMSSDFNISVNNVSHVINYLKIKKQKLPRKKKKILKRKGLYKNWKKNNCESLIGEIEILKTPAGTLAKEALENKSCVVRPRGVGVVNNGEIQDYSLISFDIINKNDDSFKEII